MKKTIKKLGYARLIPKSKNPINIEDILEKKLLSLNIESKYKILGDSFTHIQWQHERSQCEISENIFLQEFGGIAPIKMTLCTTPYNIESWLRKDIDNLKVFHYQYRANIDNEKSMLLSLIFKYKNCCAILENLENISLFAKNTKTLINAVKSLKKEVRKYPMRASKEAWCSIVSKDCNGFNLQPYQIKQTEENVLLNYEEELGEIDNVILGKLQNSGKGICLLHGEKGSGKTYYIRHLATKVKKDFIIIPTYIAGHLSDPMFLGFLIQNCRNSILVFEDVENFIKSRESGNSAIADILNIGDGLLNDITNIQIICTFNTKLENIDEALLRPGRLIARYEFAKLSIKRAKEVAQRLNKKIEISEPTALCDIFNADDMPINNKKQKTKMGF